MTREEAILILQMWWNWHNGKMPVYPVPPEKFNEALDMAIEALKEQRPHGEWKIDSEYGYIFHCVCSKCNTDVMKYISGSENWWLNSVPHFCPNCGADMREGERNDNF